MRTAVEKSGRVYTPDVLADWVAAELISRLPRGKPLFVIDPACGDGALLRSVEKTTSHAQVRLGGIDIDATAIRKAARILAPGTILKHADALLPNGKSFTVEAGWNALFGNSAIAGVISNPPWGADVRQSPTELRQAGYKLAQGQFDSYDLFIELCLRIVPEHTILAFIIPDSLFLPEHKALRTLLLDRTQLHLIARLGEGFFDNVYRGTAVVVCETVKSRTPRPVECFSLRKDLRREVLQNVLSLHDAKTKLVHLVPQKRFEADPERQFIIDVSGEDVSHFRKVHAHRSHWANLLLSGRGVELSKSGAVIFCPKCAVARPKPRDKTVVRCEYCGALFACKTATCENIVKKSRVAWRGWKRLIVGEDVDRYSCRSSRIIKTNVPGINYKDSSTFEGTKLLVRKTGVGLKAAIDNSDAFTNQVVFHYRPRSSRTPAFFLDYVLGVLCSRVMLAYHLKRTGDSEWRSHPYVTQKTIAELPVPVVSEGQWQWKQAKTIANAVAERRLNRSNSAANDLYIDGLVAGLYGLDNGGCAWVLDVLNKAQPLEAIATMRAEPDQLRAVRVS